MATMEDFRNHLYQFKTTNFNSDSQAPKSKSKGGKKGKKNAK